MKEDRSHQVAFIFDWNKRYQELSLYRITKELLGTDGQIPRYIRYVGSSGIEAMLGECGSDELKDLKTGRWHWKGTINSYFDYEGDFSEEWHSDSLTRIR